MLWFVEKTDICNFSENNIWHSCSESLNDVLENLQSYLMIPLKWLKDNQMSANPGKFQFIILSKNTINKSIVINNKKIEPFKSVKLLGLTIDNIFNFEIYINNFAKFTGKHLYQSLFFHKVSGGRLQIYYKRDSGTGVFLWILWNF